ncbi:S-adenosyl-L-methionine-dependent methyltransferase [Saccharata proteae CBS 121410]|uniref:S-adenosyl-L-methionine-dependent methyltransferase n=1 Tax=Saccharata proteae CBS 121410 TaxID=1314787 RepID=A0A9P4HZ00_9PEZI|nr:S-adenosyl-L-methionine-dependent methyltransferase [Saccharata proteae CBS 121410]
MADATNPPGVEVDQEFVDDGADSAIDDDQLSSFSASLTSSITNYPIENGRRYHAYKDGSYIMPNDEPEQDRLDLTHTMITTLLGDKLFLAPLPQDFSGKILDIGCGTGISSIRFGDLFPTATILGNDLSALQPTWVPPNVSFIVDDVESPWTYATPFQYIFCRYMAGAIGDWPGLIANVHDNLSSGGWAEFQDYDSLYYSEDGSLGEDSQMWRWIKTLVEAGEAQGRDACPGKRLEQWVRERGFVNVHHEVFKVPIGAWPRDPLKKKVGMMNLIQSLEGLEGFSLRLFIDGLKWDKLEVQVFLAKVREELKSRNIHAMYDYHVVWAQKAG